MNGAVTGGVRSLLRLEGLLILLAGLLAYFKLGSGWGLFALLFFAPDLSFAAYLAGPTFGAAIYNSVHSLASALTLLILGATFESPILISLGIIWWAHIGFDRALGYGLKYTEGFHSTHMGPIGPAKMKSENL